MTSDVDETDDGDESEQLFRCVGDVIKRRFVYARSSQSDEVDVDGVGGIDESDSSSVKFVEILSIKMKEKKFNFLEIFIQM